MYTWVRSIKKLFYIKNKVGNKHYIFWVCFCSLSYPACNGHEPFCNPWPAPLYHISPNYLINDKIFEKKGVFEHKRRVLIFSTTSVYKISHSKKTWARYDQKCKWAPCKVPDILVRFSWNSNFIEFFRKIHKYQISWKSVQWEPSCSMRTDRHTRRS